MNSSARNSPGERTPNYDWLYHDKSEQLCEALADSILEQLQAAIENKGQGVLALSGGSTPLPLFKELGKRDFDWSQTVITQVDERWVPIGHELSNATTLVDQFLAKLGRPPRFVPLFTISSAAMCAADSTVSVMTDYCNQTGSTHAMPSKFDVVVLGMGDDGHTASLFPDAENIGCLINPDTAEPLLTCHTPSSIVPRITWSVPFLTNTDLLVLHITGENKKRVFDSAAVGGSAEELPIRAMIFQDRTPLNVYYCS